MTLAGFAVSNMMRRPVRTFLTILGIALAIGTAVALLALGRGITDSVAKGLDEHGAQYIASPRAMTDVSSSRLPQALGAELAVVPGVSAVQPQLFGFALTGDGEQVLVAGSAAGEEAWRHIPMASGRLPLPQASEVAVGDVLAANLNLSIGSEITLYDEAFTVTGITNYATAMNRGLVIMDLAMLQAVSLREGQVSLYMLTLDDRLDEAGRDAAKAEISSRFPVMVTPTREMLDSDRNVQILNAISRAISIVALVMGALNLLGTLLMSVQERTREIGMLSAIGWSAPRIIRLIMLEGLIIGVLGCVAGLGVGIAGSRLFGAIPAIGNFIVFSPTATDLALPLILALPLCVAGAAYPAWRAVRMLPADALRRI